MRGSLVIGLLGAMSFGGIGCGDDANGSKLPTPTAGSGSPCVAGTSYSCFGPGACSGIRLCRDGFLTTCMCGGQQPSPADASTADASMADAAARDAAAPADAAASDASTPDAAAQAGSGGGPAPVAENCGNGKDDDGDGDTDCGDSDCGARACVAAAPAGWQGPVLVDENAGASDSCGERYPDEVLRGGTDVQAGPAACSCTCTPQGAGCATILNVRTGTSSTCDALACTTSLNASCAELAPSCLAGLATGYLQTQVPVGPANCTAAAGAPNLPDISWQNAALGCAPEAELARNGCGSGKLCAPEPDGQGKLCVYREGDHACPNGDYDVRHVYFTGLNDTRGCSACSCGNDCRYEWRLYSAADTGCTNPILTTSTANQCVAVNPTDGKLRVGVSIQPCQKSGGEPQGSVEPEDAVTVCCLQN